MFFVFWSKEKNWNKNRFSGESVKCLGTTFLNRRDPYDNISNIVSVNALIDGRFENTAAYVTEQ